MSERFLRKADIGAVFGTSPDIARSILLNYGVHPVDLGAGRGRGLRWLESAVRAALQSMHAGAQPKPKRPSTKAARVPTPEVSLANMTVNELQEILTSQRTIQ